jgi:orotate phosphoribosyltransferase
MEPVDGHMSSATRTRLIDELREHALVIGEVTLTSGAVAQYYVDAKRAILRPDGFAALAALTAAQVTTGGSTIAAIEALREAGHEICGVISVLDRLAGGGPAIERAAEAPYLALSTIDEVYPERPDRGER